MSIDTRMAIIERAERYLQESGYGSFSFRNIAADLGIKSASVHYHFKFKEDLGVALLSTYRLRFDEWVQSRGVEHSARSDLTEWFKYWSGLCRKRDICPSGAISSELNSLPKRVRAAANELQEAERRWLISVLVRGRKTKELASRGTPEDQANLVLATLQGGLQLARVTCNPKTFASVMQQLKLALFE